MDRKNCLKVLGLLALLFGLALLLDDSAKALEKLKFATPVGWESPAWSLPVAAAEDKGFWKENGLEVEWVPFKGGEPMVQAVAAGHIRIGTMTSLLANRVAARGLPILLIAQLHGKDRWFLWVLADSPVKEAKDLIGARIGVNRFGAIAHTYAQVVVKALGIEKETRIVSAGGVREGIAALKTKAIQAFVQSGVNMAVLKVKGEVREVVSVNRFLPEEWFDQSVFARRDFIKSDPETVRKAVRAIRQATEFVRANKSWSVAMLNSTLAIPEQVATLIYDNLDYTKEGKISRQALLDVQKFLVDWNILPKEKIKPAEELYTNDFVS